MTSLLLLIDLEVPDGLAEILQDYANRSLDLSTQCELLLEDYGYRIRCVIFS
jgi:hypothetical protein